MTLSVMVLNRKFDNQVGSVYQHESSMLRVMARYSCHEMGKIIFNLRDSKQHGFAINSQRNGSCRYQIILLGHIESYCLTIQCVQKTSWIVKLESCVYIIWAEHGKKVFCRIWLWGLVSHKNRLGNL